MEQPPQFNILEQELPRPKKEKSEKHESFSWLKEKLLEKLEPVFNSLGFNTEREIIKDVERLAQKHESLKVFSSEAGEFFRGLIPKGVHEPDMTDVPNIRDHNELLVSESDLYHQKLYTKETGKLSRKEYAQAKEELLEKSILGGTRKPFEGNLLESSSFQGSVNQEITRSVFQEGERNLIYERVENSIDKAKNFNKANSHLVLQDAYSGIALDLNALLPSVFEFVPSCMDKETVVEDPKSASGMMRSQKDVPDLRDYKGPEGSDGIFRVRPYRFYRRVEYGDITKTGNLLTLFHEIAHSWQSMYFDKKLGRGRLNFEQTYIEAQTIFFEMRFIAKLYKPDTEEYKTKINELMLKLKNIGIELYEKDGQKPFAVRKPVEEEGVINIKDSDIDDSYYPVRSEKLQETIDFYIAEERDAWAHALKTMRFLRSKGFDIEPQLKTLADVKAQIEPCLETYQNSIEQMIDPKNAGYRFSRLEKRD